MDCERCGEPNAIETDQYFNTAWYCQDCLDRSADRDPDYDQPTAQETYDKACKQHQELHS